MRQSLIAHLQKPETIQAMYKAEYPGISDAEAARLATIFLQGLNCKNKTERAAAMRELKKALQELNREPQKGTNGGRKGKGTAKEPADPFAFDFDIF